MMARSTLLGLALGLGALFLANGALAQCCAPPPPCCAPPPPPPPSVPPCCTPGHNVNIPGVNVFVAPSVIVNASASANANSFAAGAARGSSAVFVTGGGAGSVFAAPSAAGVIQGLNVEGQRKRTAYQATRTRTRRVVIQAVCIDDRQIPHPASQVRPDREIDDLYEGELYRCIAGTYLQATIAEYLDRVDFSKGETMACRKGEALYHGAKGKVECRPQKPGRDCYERSLLRRFGAGIKILTMTMVETYTAYREERSESVASTMSLDGGVGGVAY